MSLQIKYNYLLKQWERGTVNFLAVLSLLRDKPPIPETMILKNNGLAVTELMKEATDLSKQAVLILNEVVKGDTSGMDRLQKLNDRVQQIEKEIEKKMNELARLN